MGAWAAEVPVAGGKFIGLVLRNQIITMLQKQCWGTRTAHSTTQPALTYVPTETFSKLDAARGSHPILCGTFSSCTRLPRPPSLLTAVPYDNHSEEDFVKAYPQRTPIEFIKVGGVKGPSPTGGVSVVPSFSSVLFKLSSCHPQVPDLARDLYMDFSAYLNPTPFIVEPDSPLPRVFDLYRTMGLRYVPVVDSNWYIVGLITRKELTTSSLQNLARQSAPHDE
jgi:hypothetical protein